MITILTTSRNPEKKPWSWLLIRWCTWGVSKENYGLVKAGFWDTCKLDFAEFHLPYLHLYYTPNACFPDFSFSAILTLLLHTQCMLSWLFFFCHTYIIIAPECMLSWLFFFCHTYITNGCPWPKATVKPPVWNPGPKIEIPHPENHVLKVFRFRSWKPRVWKSRPQSWDPKSWKPCPENHILKFPRPQRVSGRSVAHRGGCQAGPGRPDGPGHPFLTSAILGLRSVLECPNLISSNSFAHRLGAGNSALRLPSAWRFPERTAVAVPVLVRLPRKEWRVGQTNGQTSEFIYKIIAPECMLSWLFFFCHTYIIIAPECMFSWLFFFCHTYIIIAPECMLSWLFFFSYCPTNATQSSQSSAEILKIEMCKYWGSNFLGAIPPFTNERNRIMEQPYLGFRAQARNHFRILA